MIDLSAFNDVAVIFGFGTDLHNADRAPNSNRHYRDAPAKMAEAVGVWNAAAPSFVVFGGDLIDQGGQTAAEALIRLAEIEAIYATTNADRFYIFGNHDLDKLTKSQFYTNSGMTEGYYSFDRCGVHFVVLDANYRSDNDSDHFSAGNFSWDGAYIPPGQRAWLSADIAATALPVIVFCHYRLNSSTSHDVRNAGAVRSILEASGKVICVITGHSHLNAVNPVNGISYYCMMAMTEGASPANAFGLVTVRKDRSLSVDGFGQQASY